MVMAMRGRVLVLVLVVAMLSVVSEVAAQCASSVNSDTVPTSPTITLPVLTADGRVSSGCSEVVDVPTMGPFVTSTWTRTSCPHKVAGLTLLETLYPSLAAGADVVLTSGQNVLLRQCSLPASNGVINRILVQTGATLVFDDSVINLHVREIYVQAGASLLAGSPTCRLFSKISITFWGTQLDSTTVDGSGSGLTSKGLIAAGIVEFHGKQYHPSWTRLARTAALASNLIYLQDAVNWEVGQDILITTTVLLDCPDDLAATWCKPCYSWTYPQCTAQRHQNEIRTISAVSMDNVLGQWVIQVTQPLNYTHYAGIEYQAEVALLSRRINFVGSSSGDNFGGHTMVMGALGQGRFSGVRGDNMGQLNIVGRYPFHLHLMGSSAGAAASYFQDCVVTNSNFRGIVVHGTNSTRLSRNIAYNVKGMCYYLEDGVEENNLLEYNLAAHVHPIFRPADGGGGQGGETFQSQSGLFLPADTSASGFYVINAMNSFIGNAASGGWSGFAFPNTPRPLGTFQNSQAVASIWNPLTRPLKQFYGNSAHSSGFYWGQGHGSCIYVGAWLAYNTGGVLEYNSGRNARDSKFVNGTSSVMIFEDTKVFLCNKGLSHWGNTVEIRSIEYHDIKVSSMLFGKATVYNALINGATPNLKSQWIIGTGKMGFQFYDTWVNTILSNITFRNFSSARGDYAVRYMDHSDHYTPQGINSVINLRFENTDNAAILGIDHCGAPCGDALTTMSSKIYSVWDWDGSFSRTAKPTLLGGNLKWWNFDSSCTYSTDWKVYMCDWTPRKTIGYMQLYIPTLMDGCDYAKFSTCTDQYAPYTVGRIAHFGRALSGNYSLDIGPWPGISGITGTGWYWRPIAKDYGINGAPSYFEIGESFQIARGNFIVLAVAYPAGTTFTVNLKNVWWGITYPTIAMAASLSVVKTAREDLTADTAFTCTGAWSDMCQVTGGVGPAWYFDGTHLYIRVVSPGCYNNNQRAACMTGYYDSNKGVRVWSVLGGFKYIITATCATCTVQSTLGTVSYWDTPDVAPAAFTTDYGTVIPTPGGLPVNKALGSFTCPAPSTSSAFSSTGTTSSISSSTATSARSSSTGSTTRSSSSSTGTVTSRSSSSTASVTSRSSSTGTTVTSASSTASVTSRSSSTAGSSVATSSTSSAVSTSSATQSTSSATATTTATTTTTGTGTGTDRTSGSSTSIVAVIASSSGGNTTSFSAASPAHTTPMALLAALLVALVALF